ncbi:substrate-binding domain-containing protein [Desulfohalovibrio reitneri]|uniref:substrate-binding domain-containing protein n=1 Tax=Desulfohalovibrio reitneri TaxID=1307759 RepID=UPI0004A77538|nr:substrate-binding domain-containing protein [Desulfohalovibrio reitneri]
MFRTLSRLVAATAVLLLAAAPLSAESLMMATTTSTDNTGLLDEIAPVFQEETGIELKWTAVGTGKALKMGENCDVDVLLVHAPPAEKKFVDSGFGEWRREIMYNDFVIIGPKSDPAGIKGDGVTEALEAIEDKKATFISRGDDSGTNKKEIGLWKTAGLGVPDKQDWYVQTGQGMLASIRVAEEKGGYTMTDRGTYIKYSADKDGNPPLDIMVEGDKVLFNQYSVIPIAPDNCPNAKYELAEKFADWLASDSTQQRIADFRLLGKALFIPNAK